MEKTWSYVGFRVCGERFCIMVFGERVYPRFLRNFASYVYVYMVVSQYRGTPI